MNAKQLKMLALAKNHPLEEDIIFGIVLAAIELDCSSQELEEYWRERAHAKLDAMKERTK